GLISYKLGLEFAHLLELYELCNDKALIARTAIIKLNEMCPDLSHRYWSWYDLHTLINKMAQGVGLLCPTLGGSNDQHIKRLRARTHLSTRSDQLQLYDGLTGLAFDKKTTVGIVYIFKLNHLVDNKMHARSVGRYSNVTQQPLKSRAHGGGQRLGEMETWALQSYGTAYVIKEMLTAKSDDIASRQAMFDGLLKHRPILTTSWCEGTLVLMKELCSLCL
ncbi:MAG: DNA-directed RNA polymerase subunit beta, partial [Candidatus Hodgkinia cicadicola]